MRPSEFKSLLKSVIAHNILVGERNGPASDRIRVGVVGEPGVGKSSVIGEAAAEVGFGCRTILASLKDPSDLLGAIFADGPYCGYLRPRELPEADERLVVLFDELGQASLPMQNAVANITLDHRSGPHDLGRFVTVIGAWNPPKSRAGSTRLPSQYLNRVLQVELKPNLADSVEWFNSTDIDPAVPFFLQFKGEGALHDFDPQRDVNATPRSWAAVGQTLKLNLPYQVEAEAIAGQVGLDHASAFNGFRALRSQIGDVGSILTKPDSVAIPEKRDVQFATLLGLLHQVRRANASNAFAWVKRLPSKELEVFFVRTLISRDEAAVKAGSANAQHFKQTDAYRQWLESGNVRYI